MFVPFHDNVISQFRSYSELAELDWDHYRRLIRGSINDSTGSWKPGATA